MPSKLGSSLPPAPGNLAVFGSPASARTWTRLTRAGSSRSDSASPPHSLPSTRTDSRTDAPPTLPPAPHSAMGAMARGSGFAPSGRRRAERRRSGDSGTGGEDAAAEVVEFGEAAVDLRPLPPWRNQVPNPCHRVPATDDLMVGDDGGRTSARPLTPAARQTRLRLHPDRLPRAGEQAVVERLGLSLLVQLSHSVCEEGKVGGMDESEEAGPDEGFDVSAQDLGGALGGVGDAQVGGVSGDEGVVGRGVEALLLGGGDGAEEGSGEADEDASRAALCRDDLPAQGLVGGGAEVEVAPATRQDALHPDCSGQTSLRQLLLRQSRQATSQLHQILRPRELRQRLAHQVRL